MSISRKHLALFLVAVLLISVAGCASEPPPPEPNATVEPTSQQEPTTPAEPIGTPAPIETPKPNAIPTEVAIPLDERSIVFISNRGDDPNYPSLYAINPDGSNLRPIDTGFHFVANPVVSPDGNVIAFWSLETGEELIYTINM
ncbi:MAG: hypothetical protein MUO76_04145, partial [Anaerolineaceae bacterium]|nr:hypothetical protein [Anaerolineaceae bacterium]